MRAFFLLLIAFFLIGCARSATLPLAADRVLITTAAAPVCGAIGAQRVALRRASIETIRRGFDRFQILGAGHQNNVRVVGHTPVVAHTSGTVSGSVYGGHVSAFGQSTTLYSGGAPIIGGSHDQRLVVQMYRETDPASVNAIPARVQLGPKWQQIVQQKEDMTCLPE